MLRKNIEKHNNMKKMTRVGILSLSCTGIAVYAQEGKVGINTNDPKATLDIKVADANITGTTKEGVLIPNVTSDRAESMGADVEESTLIYITDGIARNNTTSLVNGKGFYYFDSNQQKWIKLGAGSSNSAGNVYTAGQGMILNGNEFSRTGLEKTGAGLTIIGRTASNYSPVGGNAVDLSFSDAPPTTDRPKGAIGGYSFATGYNTAAIGPSSFATGESTAATGSRSTAMGYNVQATGFGSFAHGVASKATGHNSVLIGATTGSLASASWAFAHGRTAVASGLHATAYGDTVTASGEFSTAFGNFTTASGDYSFAFGDNATASGVNSFAFGSNVTAASDGEIALNTFRVLNDGRVGIGKDNSFKDTNSNAKLQVNGSIQVKSDSSVGCDSNHLGVIKFENDNFYGCKSTGWVQLNP